MSNSSLIHCTKLSPNHSGARTQRISRITPHCVVGQLSAEAIGGCFTSPSRKASCNYGIGYDGRYCLIVDEANRSWCSSNNDNDQRAITIECASDKSAPYAMNNAVYSALVNLCVDICKRNGITTLLWLGGKEATLSYKPKNNEAVLTAHRWFANKSCPGDWLYSRYNQLASDVNVKLKSGTAIMGHSVATVKQMQEYITKMYKKQTGKDVPTSVLAMVPCYICEGNVEGVRGDIAFAQSCLETGNFSFVGSAVTLSQNNFAGMGVTTKGMKGLAFPSPQLGIRCQIQHLKAYATSDGLVNECIDDRYKFVDKGCAPYVEWLGIQENPNGKGWAAGANYGDKILSILDSITNAKNENVAVNYKVRVDITDLNIRNGPGTNYNVVGQTGKGSFTIIEESRGQGATLWGKLKSGAGWISLDYVTKV